MEMVNKGIIRKEDYSALFAESDVLTMMDIHSASNSIPSKRTSLATITKEQNASLNLINQHIMQLSSPILYSQSTSIDDALKEKLNSKIEQRPTVEQMQERGIIDDPRIPSSQQMRKKQLHRRKASRKLEEFLKYRPKADSLKYIHILKDSVKVPHIRKRHFVKGGSSVNVHRLYEHKHERRKSTPTQKKKNKVWISKGSIFTTKRRESKEIFEFLKYRPTADELVMKNILPSSPFKGLNEVKQEYEQRIETYRSALGHQLNNDMRPELSDLERLGIVPIGYRGVSDYESTKHEYKHRRKRSETQLQNRLQFRPAFNELINKGLVHNEQYLNRRMDEIQHLQQRMKDRPDMKHIPHQYFMSHDSPPITIVRHRRRVPSKDQESFMLENFLITRPEIQHLWDRNILPSLPNSPQIYDKLGTNIIRSPPVFKYGMGNTLSSQDSELLYNNASLQLPTTSAHLSVGSNHVNTTNTNNYMFQFNINDDIDHRKHKRKESSVALEKKLNDRLTRESLFELGILMQRSSAAPSPPPLMIIRQTQSMVPSTSEQSSIPQLPQTPQSDVFLGLDQSSIFTALNVDDDDDMTVYVYPRPLNANDISKHNERSNNISQYSKHMMHNEPSTSSNDSYGGHKKRLSLVLTQYLGSETADKLNNFLCERPSQWELIHKGIVPQYSFEKKFNHPKAFTSHRRNMTQELQKKLENKLRKRPILNIFPKNIISIQSEIEQLSISKKIKIQKQLQLMLDMHEKTVEEVKSHYWMVMMDEKDRYRRLEHKSNANDIGLRARLESVENTCQQYSSDIIYLNTKIKEQNIFHDERYLHLQTHDSNVEQRISKIKIEHKNVMKNERIIHQKLLNKSEHIKQSLADEITRMDIHQQKQINELQNEIKERKQEQMQMKMHYEFQVAQNVGIDDNLRGKYEEMIQNQKMQIQELREVAEDALLYGNKATDVIDNTLDMELILKREKEHQIIIDEKNRSIVELERKLKKYERIVGKYKKVKEAKLMLERKLMMYSQQIIDVCNETNVQLHNNNTHI